MAAEVGDTVTASAGGEAAARRTNTDALAASLLVVLCLSWGLNHVAIKVANAGLQPVLQAGLRSLVGCAIVVVWCWVRRIDLFGRDGTLWPGLLTGALFGFEFVLIYVALDYTTVSRGVVLLYAMPIIVAVGAHYLLPGERLTAVRAVGLAVAFAGVVLALVDHLQAPSPYVLIGDVMFLLASAAWGGATLVVRASNLRFASPEKVLAYQLALGALIPLALSPFFGPFIREPDWRTVAAFVYQTVVVVSASYLVWFWLLARYPAAQLSAFVFLTPVFGVAFGGLLLREPVSLGLVAALTLVGGGVYLVNRRVAA